jgi:hypothetical protein
VCFTSADSQKHPVSVTMTCTGNMDQCTGKPVSPVIPDLPLIAMDAMPIPIDKADISSLTVKISFDTCSQEFDKKTWFNIFEGAPKVYVCNPATGTFNLQ